MEEVWRTLCEDSLVYSTNVDLEACFSKLISIWRNQCQSLNRRLAGSVLLDETSEEYKSVINKLPAGPASSLQSNRVVFELRKLVVRQTKFSRNCYELSFEDCCSSADEMAFVFYPVQLDLPGSDILSPHIPFPYRLSAKCSTENSIRFNFSVPSSKSDDCCRWILHVAYPGLLKWLQRIDPLRDSKPTNRLLSLESYTDTYRHIKEQRGLNIVEKWTEKTDPQKFVFEDCGIAAYLMETWKRIGRIPRCFADLGCGNGLLVHLLNAEGVCGIGLDVRKRKIWSNLLADTDLREVSIDPTAIVDGVPSEVDFLIGNHSDELTPWIPVMAAKRGCNFILIPCCPFDFHGKYHSRPGDCGSNYACFLQFVKNVCLSLGYIVEEDRLSIPSTKRLCFVCTVPESGLPSNVDEIISDLTREREGQHSKQFTARPKKTAIRNCSNFPVEVRDRLISRFFNVLLEASDERKNGWRCGGSVALSVLIRLLSDDEKKLMKEQNGGLQTFLKNQYQTFQVVNGMASIRDWTTSRVVPNTTKVKSVCWMHFNHPDGCPNPSQCRFMH